MNVHADCVVSFLFAGMATIWTDEILWIKYTVIEVLGLPPILQQEA
jgi:hypothetical protein